LSIGVIPPTQKSSVRINTTCLFDTSRDGLTKTSRRRRLSEKGAFERFRRLGTHQPMKRPIPWNPLVLSSVPGRTMWRSRIVPVDVQRYQSSPLTGGTKTPGAFIDIDQACMFFSHTNGLRKKDGVKRSSAGRVRTKEEYGHRTSIIKFSKRSSLCNVKKDVTWKPLTAH